LKNFQQTLMKNFSSKSDFKKYIAITIAIENHSKIDQILVENFQLGSGLKRPGFLKKSSIPAIPGLFY